MTIPEARKIIEDYYRKPSHTERDDFLLTEAYGYLIEEQHNPEDMMSLGGHYYEHRNFDLALKYYELAATYDYENAYECLGYVWYYGRTGERDFKKAYEYFSKAMEKGSPIAAYKIADMYKNGYYVEKDEAKYEQIIEDLYIKSKDMHPVFSCVTDIYTRLARIRRGQGRTEEAISLFMDAKCFLAEKLTYNKFFGDLNVMKWLIDDLYDLTDFDESSFDFYDLYYLLKSPHKITFRYKNKTHSLESVMEGGETVICFDGKWFAGMDDFFMKACLGDEPLTYIYDQLYDFEVTI